MSKGISNALTLDRIYTAMLARKAGRIELKELYQRIWKYLEESKWYQT